MNTDRSLATAQITLFVQLNDVYHIDTSEDYTNDNSLILPRIATIIKRLRNHYGKNRVYFCLPGDFLAPSCLSKQFKGQQMVSVLNAMGLDFVTIGNHEFEEGFTLDDFFSRVDESKFTWIGSNFRLSKKQLSDRFIGHRNFSPYKLIWLSRNNIIVLFGVIYKEPKLEDVIRFYNPSEYIQNQSCPICRPLI